MLPGASCADYSQLCDFSNGCTIVAPKSRRCPPASYIEPIDSRSKVVDAAISSSPRRAPRIVNVPAQVEYRRRLFDAVADCVAALMAAIALDICKSERWRMRNQHRALRAPIQKAGRFGFVDDALRQSPGLNANLEPETKERGTRQSDRLTMQNVNVRTRPHLGT